MSSVIALALFACALAASPAFAQVSQFVGEWKNADAATRGIVKLIVTGSGPVLDVQVWGACTPNPCDWGHSRAYAYGTSVATKSVETARAVSAVYLTTFSERILILRPTAQGLSVETYTRFTDGSTRSAYTTIENLVAVRGAAAGADADVKFVFDPAPEIGMPLESRRANPGGHRPDATPIAKAINQDIRWIRVRYFDPAVLRDSALVERYVRRLLIATAVMTTQSVHWAEGLGTPSIEATFGNYDTPKRGRLFVWPGRAVYQDFEGGWWFTSWSLEEQARLLQP